MYKYSIESAYVHVSDRIDRCMSIDASYSKSAPFVRPRTILDRSRGLHALTSHLRSCVRFFYAK
jgi:hypothetical protein